jgi:hypothetical protein
MFQMHEQAPVGDANELDSAELQSVKLFQENTPSVVNISNIREWSCLWEIQKGHI